MFWMTLAAMAVAAAVFVVRPLLTTRLVSVPGVAGLVVVAGAFGLYALIGSPDVPSAGPAATGAPDFGEAISRLETRLAEDSSDIAGWKLLGRTYMNIERYDDAVQAFRQAVELEDRRVAQTLVDLGESTVAASGQRLTAESLGLFEEALAIEAANPSALFWAGIGSANKGDVVTAADRWERLLATNPPPEIRQIVEQRVSVWRGERPSSAPVAASSEGASVTLELSLVERARGTLPDDTTVFVIARDPNQPRPPIAVKRLTLRELPTSVVLSDSDAMIPGRLIGNFGSLEIVARVSLSGQPIAQSGDWFGSQTMAPGGRANIVIDQQVN